MKDLKNHLQEALALDANPMRDDNGYVTEALSEPNLIEFWNWIRKMYPEIKKDREAAREEHKDWDWGYEKDVARFTFKDLSRSAIAFDKITSSNVRVFDNHVDKIKEIRKAVYNAALSDRCYIIVKNPEPNSEKNRYEYVISGGNRNGIFRPDLWANAGARRYGYHISDFMDSLNSREITNLVGTKDGTPAKHRIFIVIKLDQSFDTWDIRQDRYNAQKGMVENTPEYYAQVVKDNHKRWKNILAQRQAGDDKKYQDILKACDGLMNRAAKVTSKMSNYDWTEDNRWTIGALAKAIQEMLASANDMMHDVKNARDAKNGTGYYDQTDYLKSADRNYKYLLKCVQAVDEKLKKLNL
jgi:hypothetical protein